MELKILKNLQIQYLPILNQNIKVSPSLYINFILFFTHEIFLVVIDELELLFKLELNRWRFILTRNDSGVEILNSKLNLEQFYSFIFYNEFNSLRLNDAKFILDLYDLNKDSLIDFNEFLESELSFIQIVTQHLIMFLKLIMDICYSMIMTQY
jgi:hypothetical protein